MITLDVVQTSLLRAGDDGHHCVPSKVSEKNIIMMVRAYQKNVSVLCCLHFQTRIKRYKELSV